MKRRRGGLAGLILVLVALAATAPVAALPGRDHLLAAIQARERAHRPPGISLRRPPGR